MKTVGAWDLKVRLVGQVSLLLRDSILKFELRNQEIYGYRLLVLVCSNSIFTHTCEMYTIIIRYLNFA